MKKLFLFLLKIFVGLGIVGGILIFGIILKYRSEIPNIHQLVEDYTPASPSIIYDRNNKKIDVLYMESRDLANFKEIPNNVKNAFISIEDKEFYSHSGIHFKGVFRALMKNLLRGKAAQGGSSITQQLSKNAFLTSERKLSRKIKEAIITYEMERTYTKDEILEKYLNEIYFGSGSYGVKTAAKEFFRKDIKNINLAEAALLAGIPNRPSKYDPIRHLDVALARQKHILKEMYKEKYITEKEYKEALEHKFVVENENKKQESTDNMTVIYSKRNRTFYKNPEFTALVEDELQKIYTEDEIYKGGLKIYTTLDLDYQNIAKEIFDNYSIFKKLNLNGALITIDPFTGGIISIIGGKDFKAKNFNRAIMAKRQYGSTFKPFVYLSAIQNGFTPYNVVVDNFISFGSWSPKNYDGTYSGNSTLANSLSFSKNIPAIKLLESITIPKFAKDVEKLRFSGKIENLTVALGSLDVSPINLALDYSIFVNGGYMVEANLIKEIRDSQDSLIYVNKISKEKIYDSTDVSVITGMLKNVVSSGTGSRAKVYDKLGKQIEQGGKTGTTNENRTISYVGITPEYVTVIYIGRDDNKPIYGRIAGGTAVAPLWANYYQKLIDKGLYTPSKFEFLENYLETGDLIKQNIDVYTGLLSDENSKEIIVPRGRLQVENKEKYRNGIATIFNLDSEVSSIESNYISNEDSFNNNAIEIEREYKRDNLFDRLLGE